MKILAVGTLPKTIQNNLRKRNKHSSKKETLKRFKSKFQVFFVIVVFLTPTNSSHRNLFLKKEKLVESLNCKCVFTIIIPCFFISEISLF